MANDTLLAEDFAAGQISDGFALAQRARPAGGRLSRSTGRSPYNAPRSGRLLITASMTATAACTGRCDDVYIALFVDGNLRAGLDARVGDRRPGREAARPP